MAALCKKKDDVIDHLLFVNIPPLAFSFINPSQAKMLLFDWLSVDDVIYSRDSRWPKTMTLFISSTTIGLKS